MRFWNFYKKPGLSFGLTAYSSVKITSGQTYALARSNTAVIGSTGNETVVIAGGITNILIDAAVEIIRFDNEFFNYYLLVAGSKMNVYSGARTLIAQIAPSDAGSHLRFADGSRLTCTANNGVLSLNYEQLHLLPNMTISAPNSDMVITGANGYETVTIPSGVRNVRLDAAVDNIKLASRTYDPAMISGSFGELVIREGSGQLIASLAIVPNQTDTLSFRNAIGTVAMDVAGNGVFTLTDFYLGSNQSYAVNQDNLRLYGSRGKETVTLASGISGAIIDSRVDKLVLPGAYADYTCKTAVGEIQFYDAKNTLIANVYLPGHSAGTQIQFADSTATATFRYGVVSLTSLTGSGTTGTSGGSSTLQYTATYGDFGVYAAGIRASLDAAIGRLSSYFNAKGSFDLQVLPKTVDSNVLAEALGATIRTGGKQTSSAFLIESVTGSDPNSSAYDATVYINLANIADMNLNPAQSPSPSQYHLTSILEHELLHAIGFNGTIGTSAGASSPYDQFVSFINGSPYFIGPAAKSVYGGPVPLAPASAGAGSAYYHVDLPDDLMSSTIGNGQATTVSRLDLAMLQDIGAPLLVGIATVV